MGLLGKIVAFGLGVYTGVYVSQNYEHVPKVEDPRALIEKLQQYLESHKKDK